MPDGVCPYHRHCLEGLASGPAIEKALGLSAKLMTEDHPRGSWRRRICADVREHDRHGIAGGDRARRRRDAADAPVPQIRERVLKLLGGYVSSPSITPEGIDSYIGAARAGRQFRRDRRVAAGRAGAGEGRGALRLCLRIPAGFEDFAFLTIIEQIPHKTRAQCAPPPTLRKSSRVLYPYP